MLYKNLKLTGREIDLFYYRKNNWYRYLFTFYLNVMFGSGCHDNKEKAINQLNFIKIYGHKLY